MKYFLNLFVCFSNICCLLVAINGEPFNGTVWPTGETDVVSDKENEILKLRLEIMELKMEKYMTKTDRVLQDIKDYLTKLDQKVSTSIFKHDHDRVHEIQQSSVEDVKIKDMSLGKFLSAIEEKMLYFKDINTTLDICQGIQSTLAEIENKCFMESQQNLQKGEPNITIYINGKEESLNCKKNEDNKLECFDDNLPTSCDNSNSPNCFKNSCLIQNRFLGPDSFTVPCNHTTDGGGWTVIQRRVNDSVDFYRDWSEYKQGFGNLNANYWIGLDKLHALTTTLAPVELRIEMMDYENVVKYAKYDSFRIGDESTNYILKNVGVYSGNAGDSFSSHKGYKFSTKDHDNDAHPQMHCAQAKDGAWWYHQCLESNLNGRYYNTPLVPKDSPDTRGICWGNFHGYGYSLKFVQMMIRPKKL